MSDDLLRRADDRGVGTLLRPLGALTDLPGLLRDGSVLGVYIPTLGRKHRLKHLVENIHEATTLPHRVIFICENHDEDSIFEARKWADKTFINHDEPSYSNSLQVAYEGDDAPYFIGANDDFDFRPGWDVEAMKVMETPGVQVVGLFDGNPSCDFSTISLVDRTYIEVHSGVIDMQGRVNYPYKHNYVDTEFFCTAVHRGVFAKAPESWVLHKHPDFGHGQYDKTYMKSRRTFGEDAQTFESRRHLWS